MQVNNVQPRVNPSFQMAFKIKGIDTALDGLDAATAKNKFRAFAIRDSLQLKGFKKFNREQANLERYDVVYDPRNDEVSVFDNLEVKVIGKPLPGLSDITGLDYFGRVKYPGRKLFARLFHKEKFLPRNLLEAADTAKKLEKVHLAEVKLYEKLPIDIDKDANKFLDDVE